jgi:hypothetical protein
MKIFEYLRAAAENLSFPSAYIFLRQAVRFENYLGAWRNLISSGSSVDLEMIKSPGQKPVAASNAIRCTNALSVFTHSQSHLFKPPVNELPL